MRRVLLLLLACGGGRTEVAAVGQPATPTPPIDAAKVALPPLDVVVPTPATPTVPQLQLTAGLVGVQGGTGQPALVTVDPSGKLVAASSLGQLQIWDATTGEIRAQLGLNAVGYAQDGDPVFAPDSSHVAVIDRPPNEPAHALLVDLSRGVVDGDVPCGFTIPGPLAATWTARSDAFLLWCGGQVHVWDVATHRERYVTPPRAEVLTSTFATAAPAPVSPDRTRMMVPRDKTSLEIRAIADGRLLATIASDAPQARAWWTDDHTVVVSTYAKGNYAIETHDAATGRLIEQHEDYGPPTDPVEQEMLTHRINASVLETVLEIHDEPSDRRFFTGYAYAVDVDDHALTMQAEHGGRVRYDLASGARSVVQSVAGARSPDDRRVVRVEWATDSRSTRGPGRLVLAETSGRTLATWSPPGKLWMSMEDGPHWATDGGFVYAHGAREVWGTKDEGLYIYVWRASDLKRVHAVEVPSAAYPWTTVVPLPNDHRVVVASTAAVVDLATGKVQSLAGGPPHDGPMPFLQVAPDGKRFVHGTHVYDTSTLAIVEELGVEPARGEPFAPHDDRVVVVRGDALAIHTLGAGRSGTEAPLLAAAPHVAPPGQVWWNADGTRLVTRAHTLVVWDVKTGQPTLEIPVRDPERAGFIGTKCVTYGRDHGGTYVVDVDSRATLAIYDVARRDEESPLQSAGPHGLLVVSGDRYAGDALGLEFARVRATADVRSALAAPSIAPDPAAAVKLVADFVAACR